MPTDTPTPADLAALGPFFALQERTGDGWHTLRELVVGPALDERVRYVEARLAGTDIEPRVAASTMSLGLFARLVSPVIGAYVLGTPLPRPTLDGTYWRPVDGSPWPLALTGPSGTPDPAALLPDVLDPLAAAIAARYALSPQVLRGNVASAVFGAVGTVGTARPDLADAARSTGAALLAGPLAGTGGPTGPGGRFVRTSCCLYYRIPGGGYCGDCVLAHR